MAHFYVVFKIEFVDGWHLPQSFFMEEEFFSIILASYHFAEELQQLVRVFLWTKTFFKARKIIKLWKLRVILKSRLSALFIFKYDPFLCCLYYCRWFSKDTCSGTFRQIYRRLVSNKVIVLKPESLTHFSPMSHFYTPWKRRKTYGFLTFSGSIEMWNWTKMG